MEQTVHIIAAIQGKQNQGGQQKGKHNAQAKISPTIKREIMFEGVEGSQ